MTKDKSKRPKFQKPSGVGTPTLIRKKGESDDIFIARMKQLGYNLEKVGFHWVPSSDSTLVSNMIHPGEISKCRSCVNKQKLIADAKSKANTAPIKDEGKQANTKTDKPVEVKASVNEKPENKKIDKGVVIGIENGDPIISVPKQDLKDPKLDAKVKDEADKIDKLVMTVQDKSAPIQKDQKDTKPSSVLTDSEKSKDKPKGRKVKEVKSKDKGSK